MKRSSCTLFCLLLVMMSLAVPPVSANANTQNNELVFDEALHGNYDSIDGTTPYASGLLTAYKLTIGSSGGKLAVSAYTEGNAEVTKTGYTYVRVERLVNGVWQSYATWNDYYKESTSCSFGKLLNAPAGYYRAVCEHYASKPRLVIFTASEKKFNITGTFQLK